MILPLEKQLSSLEPSKRLKELGVKQESLFYWMKPIGDNGKPNGKYFLQWKDANDFCDDDSHDHKLISAFTASELLDLLPQAVTIKSVTYQIFISAGLDKQFFIVYANEKDYHDNAPFPIIMRHCLPESLARMLIFLIENKYVETSK